jgi:hypothetical protein
MAGAKTKELMARLGHGSPAAALRARHRGPRRRPGGGAERRTTDRRRHPHCGWEWRGWGTLEPIRSGAVTTHRLVSWQTRERVTAIEPADQLGWLAKATSPPGRSAPRPGRTDTAPLCFARSFRPLLDKARTPTCPTAQLGGPVGPTAYHAPSRRRSGLLGRLEVAEVAERSLASKIRRAPD